jgi:plastocyanin
MKLHLRSSGRPLPSLHRLVFSFALLACLASRGADTGSVRVEIKDPGNKPVADAVAWLTPLDQKPVVSPPAEPVVVAQNNEEFHPFVTAIVVGTRVSFPNHDKVAHHVYSQSKAKSFEIPRYRGEPKDTFVFDQPGVVPLGCNIHDWMLAYVVVLATPHFAKSGAEGLVSLAALPAGRYRLDVWHPRVKEMVTREVTLTGSDTATQVISVMLRPDKRIPRAPESGAGAYK